MRELKILLFAFVAVVALATQPVQAENTKPAGLFVNLTTDDTWSAAKAIFFAHEKALKGGAQPVAIWLNVRAVYLADKGARRTFTGCCAEKTGPSRTCSRPSCVTAVQSSCAVRVPRQPD